MSDITPRPCFKWPGGKRGIIESIYSKGLFPTSFNDYYEPFFGGGAVFFYLWSKGCISKGTVLSDINFELYNVYKHIQKNPADLIEFSKNMDISSTESTYYSNRTRFNQLRNIDCSSDELLERAILMLYLNRTAYSGMYRENKSGVFNVPFGYYTNPCIIDEDNLWAIHQAFQDVTLQYGDYLEVLSHHRPKQDDFVYFDPPYMKCSGVSDFTLYNRYIFDKDDQACLLRYYKFLDDEGVYCMLSNSSSEAIRSGYEEIKNVVINTVDAPRTISRKYKGYTTVLEYVITNYRR